MRGMALVNAATLIAELRDTTRFANPRQLMAYLGLVPSEHSSGASVKRGGITKAGNGAARRLLIEAAWSYRFVAPRRSPNSCPSARHSRASRYGKAWCPRLRPGRPSNRDPRLDFPFAPRPAPAGHCFLDQRSFLRVAKYG